MAEDWDQQLAVLRESLIALPRLVEGVSANRLHRSPAPGEWSAHVVVCHLVLDEMNTAMILRLILTQECPSLVAIDADNALCEARFAPLYPDTAAALGVWRVLREDNLRLWRIDVIGRRRARRARSLEGGRKDQSPSLRRKPRTSRRRPH